ncbi:MAG: histidine kinase [Chitinophagaceae bacterium]
MRLLILVFFLFDSELLFAQTTPYINFKTDDGLANNTCYQILQDHQGLIWVATEGGVSKFNGSVFENFTMKDGLNSNTIICLDFLSNSTIVVGNYIHGINFIYQNKVLKHSIVNKMGLLNNLYASKEYTFIKIANGYLLIPKKSTIQSIEKQSIFIEENKFLTGMVTYNNRDFALIDNSLYEVKQNKFVLCTIKGFENKDIQSIYSTRQALTIMSGNRIFYISGDSLQKTKVIPLREKIVIKNHIVDSFGKIWFLVKKDLLYKYDGYTLENISDQLSIANISLGHLLLDKEKNIWLSTQGKGIFCFYNQFITRYSDLPNMMSNSINAIEKIGEDSIVLATYRGISIKTKNKFYKTSLNKYIYKLWYDREQKLINACAALKLPQKKILNQLLEYKKFTCNYKNSNDTIYTGCNSMVYVLHNNLLVDSLFLSGTMTKRMDALLVLPNYKFFIGNADGFFQGYRQKNSNVLSCKALLEQPVNTIKYNPATHKIYVGMDGGLAILDSLFHIKRIQNIGGRDIINCMDIVFDKNGLIWLGTSSGLIAIDKNEKIVYSLDKKSGLSNYYIRCLYMDFTSNILWAGTDDGLNKIYLDMIANSKVACDIHFNLLETADTTIHNPQNIIVSSGIRNFRIHFSAATFTNNKGVLYRWYLDDTKASFSSPESEINLYNLGYGKHKLFVQAKPENGQWGKYQIFEFTIQTPFWATKWFYFFISLLLVGLGFLFYKSRIKLIHNKEKEKWRVLNQISDLKQRALAASLNPHFIFNSLNSIQYYVNANEVEKANEYFSGFATLMRKSLEASSNSFITLQDEVDKLSYYLKLEQMRIGQQMTYSIFIDPSLDIAQTRIPNMIIQPFVENSIWHGIVHNPNSTGKVEVRVFKNDQEQLLIEIIDNGIGIEESKKYKKSNHISRGVSAVEERIKLLQRNNDLCIQIKNLIIGNQVQGGTKVTIILQKGVYTIQNLDTVS